jgi:hypothetical protein
MIATRRAEVWRLAGMLLNKMDGRPGVGAFLLQFMAMPQLEYDEGGR